MKRTLYLAYLLCLINVSGLLAQDTFKAMFYNLLNFPLQSEPANRLQYLDVILSNYQPDLFMVCELNDEGGADAILSVLQYINPNYSRVAFVTNSSDDTIGNQNDLQNLLYYDSSKFILESQTQVQTLYRDFNHYKLKLNTTQQTTNPIFIDVIVGHLKSSSGTDNQALRFEMVQDLETYLNSFSVDNNVILAGDLNLYTSSEPAFVELLDTSNHITFVDPANKVGSWHNNTNYIDVFTQSTRTATGLGGATGGFDDRFDFILTSENMLTNTDLYYVSNSYKVFGNNANVNCYNQEINSENCAGPDFSFALRDALYNFSDHLPVTLQLETSQSLNTHEVVLQKTIQFMGSNVISHTLRLKINSSALNNQNLNIYNTLGQLVKTIKTQNSIYINEDTSMLPNGAYYINVPTFNTKPLMFIITN